MDCPPQQLNFVLVDFKGGGAFDGVRDLPHVVGVITDLDEALVERALVSLRAELERREQLFRDVGVSSYQEAVASAAESIARLVIVVDEFATLATDYSELMTAIIDLAARGRSLGMYLVLATQRPSGVVDQKIRANTNARIALRVQDAFDSQDVVGVLDAVRIDRQAPGRAMVRIGGDRAVEVQMAFTGAPDRNDEPCVVRPHRLFNGVGPTQVAPRPEAAETRTELQVIVDTIIAVSESSEVSTRACGRRRCLPCWSGLTSARVSYQHRLLCQVSPWDSLIYQLARSSCRGDGSRRQGHLASMQRRACVQERPSCHWALRWHRPLDPTASTCT